MSLGWAVSLGRVREVDTSSWLMHVEEHGLDCKDPHLEQLIRERQEMLAVKRRRGMQARRRKAPVLVLVEARRA